MMMTARGMRLVNAPCPATLCPPSADTSKPGTYVVTFDVKYGEGMVETMKRTIIVEPICEPDEQLCSDGTCAPSSDVCPVERERQRKIDDTGNQKPIIQLVTYPELSNVALVPQGYGYHRCNTTAAGDPEVPLNRRPCEPGASALDFEDGDVTAKVLVCPPAVCMNGGSCEGHRFVEKYDLQMMCGINTNAPVGTTYSLRFVIFDSTMERSEVVRTVQIISRCAEVSVGGACGGTVCTVMSPRLARL